MIDPVKDLLGEEDGRVIHREEAPSSAILDAFRIQMLKRLQVLKVGDSYADKVSKAVEQLEKDGLIGVTMTGAMYIDTEAMRRVQNQLIRHEDAHPSDAFWWSVWSGAFAEAVTVAKTYGFPKAEVRVMVIVEDRCEISLFVMINEKGVITDVAKPLLQKVEPYSPSGEFVEIVTDFVKYVLSRDHINNYVWLTSKVGVPTGPQTRFRGRKMEEVPAKAPDKSIPARQSLVGEESQRLAFDLLDQRTIQTGKRSCRDGYSYTVGP